MLKLTLIVSMLANVATAGMVGWFLFSKPPVRVTGGVSIYGGVRVDGGTIDAKFDEDAILKVTLCERGAELSNEPTFGAPPGPHFVTAIHCASVPAVSFGTGTKSYGLSVVTDRQ